MLDKYNPAEIESKHYQNWEEQGYFQPDMDLTKPSFSIQLPPPNVTGTLHMGHAFNQTIMDGLDPLLPHERLQHRLDSRHRPRGHRYANRGRASACRAKRIPS